MYKIIALDMDGTLLNNNKEVTSKTREALQKAREKGVKVVGATVHFVTAECDAGPIILQKAVEVMEDDTPEALQQRIMEQAEWKLLPAAAEMVAKDITSR